MLDITFAVQRNFNELPAAVKKRDDRSGCSDTVRLLR